MLKGTVLLLAAISVFNGSPPSHVGGPVQTQPEGAQVAQGIDYGIVPAHRDYGIVPSRPDYGIVPSRPDYGIRTPAFDDGDIGSPRRIERQQAPNCTPERAVRKAGDLGIEQPRFVRRSGNRLIVDGRRADEKIRVMFGRVAGCPVYW